MSGASGSGRLLRRALAHEAADDVRERLGLVLAHEGARAGDRRQPGAERRRQPLAELAREEAIVLPPGDERRDLQRRQARAASIIVALSIARMKAAASRRMSASSRNGWIQAPVTSSGSSWASRP